MWNALSYNLSNVRSELLCHHDYVVPYSAFISGRFKYVSGSTYNGKYDKHLSTPSDVSEENIAFRENYPEMILASDAGQAFSKYTPTITQEKINEVREKAKVTCNGFSPPAENSSAFCNPVVAPCLFDIVNDPCETTNLADVFPAIFDKMKQKVDYYGKIAKPVRNKSPDPRANPANFGGIWTWWYEEIETPLISSSNKSMLGEAMLILSLAVSVLVIFRKSFL